ncbi:MAG: recombinase XerD [Blastopirellula sp.]|nr:MAG: recombinase XerD [Blastopirellula sp.]
MSINRPAHIPKYRHYKPKNLGVVRLDGRDHYLEAYNTAESLERYNRLIAEWLLTRNCQVAKRPTNTRAVDQKLVAINDLLLAFMTHAQQRYVKNGVPTSEQASFKTALRPLRELYGRERVTSFGPLALLACRQQLMDAGICRKRINQHVTRIRHVFKWGVAREIVLETVWRALCSVQGLRYGEAIETNSVKPIPEAHIAAIEKFVSPHIWTMVNLQLWTGCRPGEICAMRTLDLRMDGKVWEYHPELHKTEHHNKQRVIYLGPKAQEIIQPWLKTDLHAYLFSPREVQAWHRLQRSKIRKTPVQPSQRQRKPKKNPKRTAGEKYSTIAYDRAISRACTQAEIPAWND